MNTSNVEFEKYVADYSEKNAGILSASWDMCSVNNSTYVDCPILPNTPEFAVTTYNPSTTNHGTQKIKVPPSPYYDVEVFNRTSSTWDQADSTLLCYDFIENNEVTSTYEDCDLYVDAKGLAQHMTFMKVTAQSESPASEI